MKKNSKIQFVYILFALIILLISCTNDTQKIADAKTNQAQNEKAFKKTLKTLLAAIENRDLDSLKSTMPLNGEIQLILPRSQIKNTVDEFVSLHQEWFKDSTWTMETKIINTKIGDKIGMAVTEAMYREPNRNGVPYFNHMIVSYVLEKTNSQWYIIQDHASSIEKTKSKENLAK